MNVVFEIPSWDQIYEMLLNVADKIRRDRFKPDIIVGVSRGGWLPARIMSDLLENPEIANVKAEHYMGIGETKGETVVTQPISVQVKGKTILVMDDVVDTGHSLIKVRTHLLEKGAKDVKIATIYYKPWSIIFPHYYEKETKQWVIFPWDRKETVKNLLQKFEQQGKSTEDIKEKLIESGFDRKLVDRFIQEILEGKNVK